MENDAPISPTNPPTPLSPPRLPITPPRQGNRRWLIFFLVLAALAVIALAGGAKFLIKGLGGTSHAQANGRTYEEHVIEDNDAGDKIAVIEVQGLISSYAMDGGGVNMITAIKDQLKLAGKDDAVKAVLLKVDSPGGEVLASDEIYRAIQQFQQDTEKPVIASMGSLAASGGYYVSAPCRWIVANELTITGSIGVIMQTYNYRGLMDKVGVQPMTFKSGKFKDMLSGSKLQEDILPEEKQMVQSLIEETFGKFKQIVADGREQAAKSNEGQGKKLATDWRNYADGRILSGTQALELGFVDELGDFEAAVKRAQQIAGISDANLIHYQAPVDFLSMLRLFGKTDVHSVKVDLGLDLPRLQMGRLYFLSPLGMH